MKTLCIYHGNCADGFGAAWVVRQALGGANVDFHAAAYGKPAPEVAGRSVIIVDFSYPLETLQQMAEKATSILVIDHHKTAAEALAQLSKAPSSYLPWMESYEPLSALFDMHRSGAGLTWDFFFPAVPRPALINHIEDRDLWQFKLEGTKDVMAAVFSHPQDFATWDLLATDHIEALRLDGHAIERKQQKDVADLVASNSRRMIIGGVTVPAVNLPRTMASDAGHILSHGQPFAAIYWDTPEGRSFSLRSTDAGEDVSAIAKQYDGGGHRNAAGFRVPAEHPLASHHTPQRLRCYQVGDTDVVAAYSPASAIRILREFCGYPASDFTEADVTEWTDAQLDAPCFEEDGITPAEPWRVLFTAQTAPGYLGGWE